MIQKNFTSELQIITDIESLKSAEILIYKNDISQLARITKENKNFKIELSYTNFFSIENTKKENNILVKINDKDLFIDSLFVCSTNTSITNFEIVHNTICSANTLRNKPFLDNFKSIFKCFIPIEKSIVPFLSQFETIPYYDCIEFNVDNILFHLTSIKRDNERYFVIESFEEIEFNNFCEYCYSIKQSFGFVSGYMPGGEEFFFSKDMDFYYTSNTRASISSIYYPIHTNPNGVFYGIENIVETYADKLNVLPAKIFSNLVTKVHDNLKLSSSIILILEASSIRSLLMIPSIFAVVLEALSEIITIQGTNLGNPLKKNKFEKELIKNLSKEVDAYPDINFNLGGKSKIRNRIQDAIKRGMDRFLKNNEKLRQPFEQLGFVLTTEDINVIEHRNGLLHGNLFLENQNRKSLDEINNYMLYVSGKLYTLLSSLILKYVGYSGYIINHAKLYEDSCGRQTQEEYYKLI